MMTKSGINRMGALAAAAGLVVAMAACSPGQTASAGAGEKSYKLAGTSGLQSDPFWISMTCGGTAAAKAAGSTIDWKSTADTSTTADQAVVDGVKILQPDALVINAGTQPHKAERTAWMKAGTPVSVVGSAPDDTEYLQAFTAYPEGDSVVQFGDLIGKTVGDSGTVAIMGGVPGLPFLEGLWKPVVDDLNKKHPAIKVLPTEYDAFDVTKTSTIVSGLILAHPDLKAIYTLSGPEGTGAVAAVKAAGKTGQIDVFSGGGDPNLVDDVRNGSVTALLSQSPYEMGSNAVKAVLSQLKKGQTGPVTQGSPAHVSGTTMILTKENIDADAAKNFKYLKSCDQ